MEFLDSLISFFTSFFNQTLPVFILILSALVFVHELGHYLAAIRLGVHIEEFGLGFPPRLAGAVKDKDNKWRFFFGQNAPKPEELGGPRTIYSLNWIPLGGFVRPVGEDDPLVPGGLSAASKRVRFIVLVAGSAFNIIFAFFVLTLGFSTGWPDYRDEVSIGRVESETPAEQAGLQAGDIIVQLDSQVMTTTQAASDYIRSHRGQPVVFLIQRGADQLSFTITPRTPEQMPAGQEQKGATGIALEQPYDLRTYALPEAMYRAGGEIVKQFLIIFEIPGMLIRQQVALAELRPVGIIGIKGLTDLTVEKAQEKQHAFYILQFMALISVALGMTNLLPIPALDGGRILFVIIEAIRGRRISPERETQVHLIGFAMLLILMVVITYQDIFHPLVPR